VDLQQKVLSVDFMDDDGVTSFSNPLSAELDEVRGSAGLCCVYPTCEPSIMELLSGVIGRGPSSSRPDQVQSEEAQRADGEGESFDRGNGSNKSLASTSPKYGATIVDEGNEGDVGTAMQAAKPSASEAKRLQVCGGVKGRSSRYRQNHRHRPIAAVVLLTS
jgi:hypothetical protein